MLEPVFSISDNTFHRSAASICRPVQKDAQNIEQINQKLDPFILKLDPDMFSASRVIKYLAERLPNQQDDEKLSRAMKSIAGLLPHLL